MKMKKRKSVKVHIKKIAGKYKVEPSCVWARPGETVEFIRTFPGVLYVQLWRIGRGFSMKKGVNVRRLKIAKRTSIGIYPFAVFCYGQKTFCTGSSMPIIIVPPATK
ncbi:MAG TPA: hypothetical protein VMS71_01020 [Candidatus Acidoferrum sp.]|nr:hypothetical protein [Candidatus Acidoferrum sp.]